jgi:hypothetical protein
VYIKCRRREGTSPRMHEPVAPAQELEAEWLTGLDGIIKSSLVSSKKALPGRFSPIVYSPRRDKAFVR